MSKVKRLRKEHDEKIQALTERQRDLDDQLRKLNRDLRENKSSSKDRELRETKSDLEKELQNLNSQKLAAEHRRGQELDRWQELDARFSDMLAELRLHVTPDPSHRGARPIRELLPWLRQQATRLERQEELDALVKQLPDAATNPPKSNPNKRSSPSGSILSQPAP